MHKLTETYTIYIKSKSNLKIIIQKFIRLLSTREYKVSLRVK